MPAIHFDDRKEREAAVSIAREMAAEGMTTRRIRKELDRLELGWALSDLQLHQIVSRHRPWWKIWFPLRYRFGRRLLGGSVALVCLIGMIMVARVFLPDFGPDPDPDERLRQQGDALAAIIQLGLWFGVSLWLFLRPDDGDEEILDDGDGLAWRVSWFH